jgi:C1A family cysteine protease
MSDTLVKPGLGWIPDLPDFRDFVPEDKKISDLMDLAHLTGEKPKRAKAAATLPSSVDLREWCSPIEDQETIGSCTAHAGAGIVEYFENRAFGRHVDLSRLFLYKVTRNLLHWTGDTGAYLRSTMKALALFGAPPEEFWPYKLQDYDVEPPAFCYAYGQHFEALQYYRLDGPGTTLPDLLIKIKTHLAAGVPSMFGFTVYTSISQAGTTGKIPYPAPGDKLAGGHAVDAIGYDDAITIQNAKAGAKATKGALLIRNSWGNSWGAAGYGWLPYEYILRGQARDWWVLVKGEWFDHITFE